MGCAASKQGGGEEEAEAGPAAHCRARSALLADAIRHRYALADAHAAHASSLRSVGAALHPLLLLPSPSPAPSSLPLPPLRKLDHHPPPRNPLLLSPSSSPSPSSSSHLHFHPDSDSDSGSGSGSAAVVAPPSIVNLSYARNHPATQLPYSSYQVPPQSSNLDPPFSFSYSDPYASYGAPGAFFGPSYPLPPPPATPAAADLTGLGSPSSSSKAPPPPPPSPPRASSWDFLNPFESYDSYYAAGDASGRSSRRVREEEGIPELEEEGHDAVKGANGGELKRSPAISSSGKPAVAEDDGTSIKGGGSSSSSSSSSGSSSGTRSVEHGDRVAGDDVRRAGGRQSAVGPGAGRTYGDDSEVAQEIKAQFDRASESADRVSRMLEVGKLPYHHKHSSYNKGQMNHLMIS